MNSHGKDIKIFTLNSNKPVAQGIAECLGIPLGKSDCATFSDGEIAVSLHESVRGSDCFIVQSTCSPVNDNLMELLIMIDAMKRASASSITAVVQYFGYARQDNIPVDHLVGAPMLAKHMKKMVDGHSDEFVVVSPDLGSVTRARNFAAKIGCPIAIIDKRRQRANVSEVMNIIGEVKGKKCILVDDMIDTAGTLCNAANAIVQKGGAIEVYACASHAVLSGPAIDRIRDSAIKECILLDTVPVPEEKMLDKFTILSTAPLWAEAIERIYEDKPVSPMFL